MDAANRALRLEVAAYAMVVDAKSEQAVMFYEHHGFKRFESQPGTLFLPAWSGYSNLHGRERRRS
jgi:hypothetical protein